MSMFGYVMCGIQPQRLQLVKVRAKIVAQFFLFLRDVNGKDL